MAVYFISDMHLDADSQQLRELFFQFMRQHAPMAEEIYILGDFFERWVGDDVRSKFIDAIIATLKAITDLGIPIYIMHGNRDFLLGKQFCKLSGCQLLPDPSVIKLNDQNILLTHGDALCLDDKAYLRFRRIARTRWIQQLFLLLPMQLRRWAGTYARNKSSGVNSVIYDDATPDEVIRLLKKHDAQQMIHGHTHQPGMHYFLLNGNWARRIVLSDWGHTGNFLRFENENLQLNYFNRGTPL